MIYNTLSFFTFFLYWFYIIFHTLSGFNLQSSRFERLSMCLCSSAVVRLAPTDKDFHFPTYYPTWPNKLNIYTKLVENAPDVTPSPNTETSSKLVLNFNWHNLITRSISIPLHVRKLYKLIIDTYTYATFYYPVQFLFGFSA